MPLVPKLRLTQPVDVDAWKLPSTVEKSATLVLAPLVLRRTSIVSRKPSPAVRTKKDNRLVVSNATVGVISQLLTEPAALPVLRKLAAT